jgi:hypothetical protein
MTRFVPSSGRYRAGSPHRRTIPVRTAGCSSAELCAANAPSCLPSRREVIGGLPMPAQTWSQLTLLGKSTTRGRVALQPTVAGQRDRGHPAGKKPSPGVGDGALPLHHQNPCCRAVLVRCTAAGSGLSCRHGMRSRRAPAHQPSLHVQMLLKPTLHSVHESIPLSVRGVLS